jgi:hypothetical protein
MISSMGLRAGVTTFVYAVTTFFYKIVVVLLQSYLRRSGVLNGAVEDKVKEIRRSRRMPVGGNTSTIKADSEDAP